ncbi:helix-turn-helix domain-containing protein [Cytophagaceae bacterium DM2B3-1]|uniref:Helix-turn-helix domain-containing protein n=1 Tax=Xanthocytophaga flava TaxID=3048013 RepID=A0ABT7CT53_9BACT|nr:helix-turn-helix domain-containing protein [Xanthocytophaga flavus]MDJ1471444.1 helix-turn-helix domain-containing protein [Xanthocytophaga flavus]MDJ1496924.1 helix-turn-helix domain-containing protein [Xanthocytophaga flavus]
MDLMKDLGALAFGSRLKRLSDKIMKQANSVYQDYGLDFEPKWFPLFYILSQKSELGIMEIADNLGISHPGVIQLAKELEKKGWITSAKSKTDARKRILTLTKKGKLLLPKLQDIWEKIRQVNEDLINNRQHNLILAITEVEDLLTEKEYLIRFKEFHHL